MALVLADRVKETTTTEGTGAFALGGAVNGFLAFSSRLSVGDTTWYAAILGTQWEVGLGTLTSTTTLARTSVIASSNGDAAVSFAAGAKEIFLDAPAVLLSRVARLNSTGAVAHRNRIINGNFSINQRGAAAGSTSYAAGAYVMDRWKAGSGGCTLSFTTAANGDVTVAITAGTLVQIIEGPLYLPEGGSYVLSWTGTATARLYQGAASGAYAASPIAATGLTAGTNTVVEFSTGTLTLAQLEPGTQVTPFERRDDELKRASRYYRTGGFNKLDYAAVANAFISTMATWDAMMGTPNVAIKNAAGSNAGAISILAMSTTGVLVYAQGSAAGNMQISGSYTAEKEL